MTNDQLFYLTRKRGRPLPGGVISVRHLGADKVNQAKLLSAFQLLFGPDGSQTLLKVILEREPDKWVSFAFSGFSDDSYAFRLIAQGCGVEVELLNPGVAREDYAREVVEDHAAATA